ncbi:membrane protein insertion efficiency factor YidD [Ahrensia sp. R2A130]|uniref:membrane protein insertion efficiency factor YidD n=1 Tax=Ahrensia sp. R2A130 TaxID=744979 RepID=UPI000A0406AE|nr:membrane protein insertion efficiency factor YidD [Ahrensia sp. R2A130]
MPKGYNRNYSGPWPKTPARLLGVGLIRFYQLTFSSFIGGNCRYVPTCSEYGYEAIARYGLLRGGLMTLRRVGRCNPWRSLKGSHGHDPVP